MQSALWVVRPGGDDFFLIWQGLALRNEDCYRLTA